MLVCAVLYTNAAYTTTEVTARWATLERQYHVGALSQCQALFNVLAAGQLFTCEQKNGNGTALVNAAADTLLITLYNSNPNITYTCHPIGGTSVEVFSLVPDDIGQSAILVDPALFTISTAAICLELQMSFPEPKPIANPNYTLTYSSWARSDRPRASFAMEPIVQCNGFFNYITDNREVITCSSADSQLKMYFSFGGTIVGVSIRGDVSSSVTCTNKANTKKVDLAPSIVGQITVGTERGNKQNFIQGMSTACITLQTLG